MEKLPKMQSFPNERTRSTSPLSRRTFRTTSFFDPAKEPEADAPAVPGVDQFILQSIRSSYRKEIEEDLSKIGRDSSFRTPFTGTPTRSSFTGTPTRSSRVCVSEESSESPRSDPEQDDSITILTYSKSPYADFRQSMQEMVQARVASNGAVDRQFMEELLFRYLDLNSEKYYGCIVRAFLDLIVISNVDPAKSPARRRPWLGGRKKLKLEIKRVRKFCENQFVFVPK